jgi:predicted negative regulator of RcsB-dependent stress response
MDDYYNEQEQWERVKQWLRENGLWLLAGVAIGVAALAGWRWWEARVERLAVEASGKYQQVLEAFGRGDRTRGTTVADELRRDYKSSPYADQADLVIARAHVEASEYGKAVERLQRVAQSSKDAELRHVARLRLARVQIAQGNADQALATLAAAGETGAFASRYAELRGDALHSKGDRAGALREYRAARSADTEGVLDVALLELKINDLAADGVAEPAAPAAPAAAAPSPAG